MTNRRPKVMVANRGEISVRIFRAAQELSMETVAIYAESDQFAGHRQKADYAYAIAPGKGFGPVEAYLNGEAIIDIAVKKNVDFIHPGYGFLAENSSFAAAVNQAGIIFVGPSADVIELTGNKVRAREAAMTCGIPTVPGTEGPVETIEEARTFIVRHGLPVIVKASYGGGGRGMRVIRDEKMLEESLSAAKSEALAAFGNSSVFIEKYLERPKHIEVQILADNYGNCIHLFERDCSVQRKHQKIIEFAPATCLSNTVLTGLHNAAVNLAKHVNYVNAGTVEFLVERDKFYFIEMNPRIQVEHTVTEELTGIDIVSAQLLIASGLSISDIGLSQDKVTQRGSTIQCRVTTEVPAENFRPDTGRIEFCALPTGHGVRLDFSDVFQGAVVTPYFDPLLLKCTFSGPSLGHATRKAIRALDELRIKGVATNIAYLAKILQTPDFKHGTCWTTFIDDHPSLLYQNLQDDEATKFLRLLADSVVNGSRMQGQTKPPALGKQIFIGKFPAKRDKNVVNFETAPVDGWRSILTREGPVKFAQKVREHPKVLITDTTWRDGQQSLLATRVRTKDLVAIAQHTSQAYNNAYSLENWGGATFDVALRFLYEDPWERLRKLRKLIPNIPFQMLLRSTNGVAYSALPDNAIYHFVKLAKDAGMDIFRVFDCLNNIDNLEVGIKAVLAAGGVAEGAIMYTGDLLQMGKYSLEYYMSVADKLVEIGVHVIAIKSMSGVMKPAAARALVGAIRLKYSHMPIHVHTHDNNGTGIATMVACVEAGADIVDTAIDSVSGTTSQPAVSSMIAALQGTGKDSELSLDDIAVIDDYWAQLRLMYSGFDADLRSPDPRIYRHEIPGGQYSNLLFQARQNGLGSQWQETLNAYEEANLLLGNIIKATPTSKAVGDLAQFMVDNKLNSEEVTRRASSLDFPDSVLDYFEGLMGQPFDGFPEPLRTQVLGSRRQKLSARPGLTLKPINFDDVRTLIGTRFPDRATTEYDVASYIMYPEVYMDFRDFHRQFGDIMELSTLDFMLPPKIGQEVLLTIADGKDLTASLVTVGAADEKNGKRDVLFRLNGEFRSVAILDKSAIPKDVRPKAEVDNERHVAAPMSGKVIRVNVLGKAAVAKGDSLVAVSAMKMELNVTARRDGQIRDVFVAVGDIVEKEDLLLTLE